MNQTVLLFGMNPAAPSESQCTHASSCSCAIARAFAVTGSNASSHESLLSAARTGSTAFVPSSDQNRSSISTSRSAASFVSVFSAVAVTFCGSVVDVEIGRAQRLNSSHGYISYAVFCLKKKKNTYQQLH